VGPVMLRAATQETGLVLARGVDHDVLRDEKTSQGPVGRNRPSSITSPGGATGASRR
jgi:hypothetical protein